MGWTVILTDSNRTVLRQISNDLILSNEQNTLRKELRVVKYLDEYGDTIFNQIMLDDLKADLEKLSKSCPDNNGIIVEIIQLISECKNSPHLYLEFCGD